MGGAAAAAAGYMIYEYQQQNERNRSALIPPSTATRDRSSGATVDEKARALSKEVQQRKDESAKWIKEQAEEKKKSVKDEFEHQKAAVQSTAADTSKDASRGWERIKEGVSEDGKSIKEALLGSDDDKKAKDHNKSIFNRSFNEAERAKAIAIGDYDRVNKEFNTLLARFNESKKGMFDSGDALLKQQLDDFKNVVKEKKEALDKASKEYADYTRHNFNEISNKLDEQDEKIRKEGGFFKWLTRTPVKGEKEKSGNETNSTKNNPLAGFGENAAFFSQEQIEEQLRNKEIGPSEAQKRLDVLKRLKEEGWYQHHQGSSTDEEMAKAAAKGLSGWGESAAQFAQEEIDESKRLANKARNIASREDASKAVDDAWKKLQDAKKTVDETSSKWWSKGKEKTNEISDEASKKYAEAQKNYEAAKKTLSDWSDKSSAKFWSSADDAIRVAQNAADQARDKTQGKLHDSQDNVEQEQLLEE